MPCGSLLSAVWWLHVSQKLNVVLGYMLHNISDSFFQAIAVWGVCWQISFLSVLSRNKYFRDVMVFVIQHHDPVREIICTMFPLIEVLKIGREWGKLWESVVMVFSAVTTVFYVQNQIHLVNSLCGSVMRQHCWYCGSHHIPLAYTHITKCLLIQWMH
jgi:hypothetical protein